MPKFFMSLLIFIFSAWSAAAFEITVSAETGDFIDKGFASVQLTAEGVIQDKNIEIEWSVISVQNNSEGMAEGWEKRICGLSWFKPIPGNDKRIENAIGSTVVLTDIIGERDVKIAAKVKKINSKIEIASAEKTIHFGRGPLSLFKRPLAERVAWLDAYKECNGDDYPGDLNEWRVGFGFEGGNKMPHYEMLQAVSMPGVKNPIQNAFGAALASGWQNGWYWNGRVVMKQRASHVNLQTGTIHGSGGSDIYNKQYLACLK